jgi:flagellar P-ring protein precursor FlgI
MKRVLLILTVLLASGGPAQAVKIGDITRLAGERPNALTGLGLVVGLKGTGDGGQFGPAIRPLAAMLAKFADKSDPRELSNVSNVALVTISVIVPPRGALNGDKLDVVVTSVGVAPSLKGGRLMLTPVLGPTGDAGIFAMAGGDLVIEDPSTPTKAVVPGGAVMETDLKMTVIENGKITLILQDPSADWTTASTIAKIINDAAEAKEGEVIAVAEASNYVVVTVPPDERPRPDSFISRIRRLPVPMLPTEARVEINEKTGTIVMTGDVEISPVVISHQGLTISTTNPPAVPTARTPVTTEKQALLLDTTNQGGAKLQELVDALDLIRVPAADRITIIKELHKTGKLHAKLIIAGQN